MAQNESSSIPQVAACVLIGYLVLRWFFKGDTSGLPATASPNTRPALVSPADRRRLTQQVDVVRGMFPQFSAAAVEAELLRNGGNIEITTERILSTGYLPEPPAPRPVAAAASAPAQAARTTRTGATPTTSSPSAQKSQYSDLITRYNLHSRLQEESAPSSTTPTGKSKAPASKEDRRMAHKTKRDEMVLEARRSVEKAVASGKHQV